MNFSDAGPNVVTEDQMYQLNAHLDFDQIYIVTRMFDLIIIDLGSHEKSSPYLFHLGDIEKLLIDAWVVFGPRHIPLTIECACLTLCLFFTVFQLTFFLFFFCFVSSRAAATL